MFQISGWGYSVESRLKLEGQAAQLTQGSSSRLKQLRDFRLPNELKAQAQSSSRCSQISGFHGYDWGYSVKAQARGSSFPTNSRQRFPTARITLTTRSCQTARCSRGIRRRSGKPWLHPVTGSKTVPRFLDSTGPWVKPQIP